MAPAPIRERHIRVDPALIGDNMLVVFMPDGWAAEMYEHDLEYYSLWVDALEDYLRRSEGVRSIRRMDFRRADEVFFGRGLPVNEYTILFVRSDGWALYSDVPIYDPVYYDYADAFLLGREDDVNIPAVMRMGQFESFTGPYKTLRLSPWQTRRATQMVRPRVLPEEEPRDSVDATEEVEEDELTEEADENFIESLADELDPSPPSHPAIEESSIGALPGQLSPTPEFHPSPEDIEAGVPLMRRVETPEEVESGEPAAEAN